VTVETKSSTATAANPSYYDGPTDVIGDVVVNQRYYTYPTDVGLVAGKTMSVAFTIDRSSTEVWPVFKDFNRWQSSHHIYSGVAGDLEGQRLRISNVSEPGVWLGDGYDVVRVIPERTIVLLQPVTSGQLTGPVAGFQGGGISPGFHVFLLNEHEGKTEVSILMQHAMGTPGTDVEEALKIWRELAPQSQEKWRDSFIPTLKRLINEGP
jgi:hypothetical protein